MTRDEIEQFIIGMIATGQIMAFPQLATFLNSELQPVLISQMAGYMSRGR
jgi:hypothetical protein